MNKVVYDPDALGRCGGEILFLAGDTELMSVMNDAPDRLACSGKGSDKELARWRAMFRTLCHRLAAENELDVIIVDLGPSNSVFNEWLIASSDFILPPTSASAFGAQSARNMVDTVLPMIWIKQAEWLKASVHVNSMTQRRDMNEHERSKSEDEIKKEYLCNPLTRVLSFNLSGFTLQPKASEPILKQQQSSYAKGLDVDLAQRKEHLNLMPKPWYVDPDVPSQLFLPLCPDIVPAAERVGHPVTLFRGEHAEDQQIQKTNLSHYKETIANIHFRFAQLANNVGDIMQVQDVEKQQLSDNDAGIIANAIHAAAQATANKCEKSWSEEQYCRQLMPELLDKIKMRLPNARMRYNPSYVGEVNNTGRGRHIACDFVIWANGPFDRRMLLLEVKCGPRPQRENASGADTHKQQLRRYVVRIKQTKTRNRYHESYGLRGVKPLHMQPPAFLLNFVRNNKQPTRLYDLSRLIGNNLEPVVKPEPDDGAHSHPRPLKKAKISEETP